MSQFLQRNVSSPASFVCMYIHIPLVMVPQRILTSIDGEKKKRSRKYNEQKVCGKNYRYGGYRVSLKTPLGRGS